MLIYNFQKEFLGIDKDDLEALGFSNLAELRAESEDFADLFVKTPGHIQNFQHAHWIDFLLYPEDGDENKVIIHAKGKNYKCQLKLKIAYLVDSPSQEAYLINLRNLRELTNDEVRQISIDLGEREAPKPATSDSKIINIPKTKKREKFVETPLIVEEKVDEIIKEEKIEEEIEDSNENIPIEIVHEEEKKDDTPIDINFDDEDEITLVPQSVDTKIMEIKEDELELSDYVFDPKIASDDLGLTLDLIEEFIEDFIAQAKDFKEELFSSLENGNLNQVRSLSHKLKGVAANLRVEDAREALVIINTSQDINKIKSNLVLFYKIIAKLENKNVKQKAPQENLKEQEHNTSGYDKNLVAKEIGIDIDSFNEIFKDFIQEVKKVSETIISDIKQNDSEKWKQNAVHLRTLSENMRLDLYNTELEDLIKTDDSTQAKVCIDKINTYILEIDS